MCGWTEEQMHGWWIQMKIKYRFTCVFVSLSGTSCWTRRRESITTFPSPRWTTSTWSSDRSLRWGSTEFSNTIRRFSLSHMHVYVYRTHSLPLSCHHGNLVLFPCAFHPVCQRRRSPPPCINKVNYLDLKGKSPICTYGTRLQSTQEVPESLM